MPIYQIQDFHAQAQKERYFYFSTFAAHLQEHLFIREPHKHNFYIIIFITQGTGTHTIDFKKYEVRENMAFFLVPGQVHSWELSEDADGFVVFFTQEFYQTVSPTLKLSGFPFFNALLHTPFLPMAQEEALKVFPTFRRLQEEYQNQALMRQEALGCYLDLLLIHLSRLYQAEGNEMEVLRGELSLLQSLEGLLEKHYKEHLPVTFYADQLHVTPKHLTNICKRSLGKTTTDLIQERAVLEAQRLLVHSELTSSQIAAELGYFDNHYFFRFFKKHTECTPEQFRSRHR
ncbi:AraC family transcriptional regulator [Rufibacter glacialis]|nr:AraC family transcriptional regulator [Rufibacter glacialis]